MITEKGAINLACSILSQAYIDYVNALKAKKLIDYSNYEMCEKYAQYLEIKKGVERIKNKKRKKLEDIQDIAMFKTFKKPRKPSKKQWKKYITDCNVLNTISEVELFYKGKWFRTLTNDKIDYNQVLERARKEAEENEH